MDSDRQLAEHITYVHRKGEQPKSTFNPIPMNVIRFKFKYSLLHTVHLLILGNISHYARKRSL